MTIELTPDQRRTVNEAVGWDDRKQVADLYQDAGGRVDDLSDATYKALLAVARWGAAQGVLYATD